MKAEEVVNVENKEAKLIGFVEKLSGGLLSNGLGIVTDHVEHFRLMRGLALRDKLNDELKKRGITKPAAIRPKILIPLLMEATLEDDDDLQMRYALLLANACDPDYKGIIQRNFVSILAELEPIDVAVLDYITSCSQVAMNIGQITKEVSSLENISVSIHNLVRLGMVELFPVQPISINGGVVSGGIVGEESNRNLDMKYSEDSFLLKDLSRELGITALGKAFMTAVQPQHKQSTSSALDELQKMGQEYEAG